MRGHDFARLGEELLVSGDLETATKALRVAAADKPRNVEVRIALAQALRRQGAVADAAVVLTEALAITPVSEPAARALSILLQRFTLDEPDDLVVKGLRAALGCAAVDRQPIARTAFHWLKTAGVLQGPLERGRRDGWQEAAASTMADRTGAVLRDGLLRDALASGINTDPEIEFLLTALRRHIVRDVSDDSLMQNRDLFSFCLALAGQLDLNEHVWGLSEAEAEARSSLKSDYDGLAAGDAGAAAGVLKTLLHYPIRQTELARWDTARLSRVRPKALGQFIAPRVAALQQELELAEMMPRFTDIDDATSQRVAAQYEHNPYPRWTSLTVDASPIRLDELERTFGVEVVKRFRAAPFDVLVAGCGTGHHAGQIAVAYGPNARILGVDLSRASLAYAQRMTEAFNLDRVSFGQADLLDAGAIGQCFDIIECIGVLHHMADPFAGWRSVLEVLKPGGLMFVGLYSAVARSEITSLRAQPDYPGPGCDDDAARAYRAGLLKSEAGSPGASVAASQDFHTLSDFRDLVLHENEIPLCLEEIAAFLDSEGLVFHGFQLDAQTLAKFAAIFPDDGFPGSLAQWAVFEREHPRTFEGMYNFWCRKAG